MKQLIIKTTLLLLVTILYPLYALRYCYADVQIHPKAGTTSAAFLKYGIGSRAVALGNTFVGLADDMTALYWNPAGLAMLTDSELSVTHNESFENIRHDFAGYAFPFRKGTLAVAAYGLYTPKDIERRSGLIENDPYEPVTSVEGLFQAYDVAAHVSYARYFSKELSLGASLKYIQQTIDTYNAYAGAVDIGSLYQFRNLPLSLGLALTNIGTPVKFINKSYDLPLSVKLGSAYKFNKLFTAVLDLHQPNDNYLFVSAGTEFKPAELLSLRAGYRYRINGLELGDLHGFSAGIGFNFRIQDILLKVDYAFVPYSVLGDSQRLTLSMVFGRIKETPRKDAAVEAAAPLTAKKPTTQAVQSPRLPEPPPPAPLKPSLVSAEYDMYAVKMDVKRRTAGGRQTIYLLTGKTAGSDLVYLEGTVKFAGKDIAMEVGEKKGEGKVYKSFVFKKNFTMPVFRIVCKVRVPKAVIDPIIVSETGEEIKTIKASEDDDYSYYKFFTDTFKPFRIESK